MAQQQPVVSVADPSILRQVERQTAIEQQLSGQPRTVSNQEIIYSSATAATTADTVTVTQSVNNQSGDVVTVYATPNGINVTAVDQTVNTYSGVGATGAVGPAGATGPQGPAGPTGADGATGATGPTGATGVAGDRYSTTSSTSLTIGLGTQTLTVGTGLAYSLNQDVVIAYDGSNDMNGPVVSYDSGTGVLVINAIGVTGSGTYASWSVNLDGAVGAVGSTGATGPQGIQGDTGATGPAGTNGLDGATGATGPQGIQGDTGATGPQGIQGDTGATGADGATGPQGIQGDTGATGPAGTNGTDGATGATGPQGDAGATGATGPAPTVSGGNNEVQFNISGALSSTGNFTFIDGVDGGAIELGSASALQLIGNGTIQNPAGNVVVTANSATWRFYDDGNLMLPGNTVAIKFLNGSSAFGNVVSVNLDGSSSNLLYGNGVFAAAPASTYGDSNVTSLLGSFGSNTISTTGNVATGAVTAAGKIGYSAGNTVTQTTSRGTGVTLNALSGEVTLLAATMTAGQVDFFTMTNSEVNANDIIVCSTFGGSIGTYLPQAYVTANTQVAFSIRNLETTTTGNESPIIKFIVIKAPVA